MRVFVTGASGLIGARLVEALLGRGDQVVALSRRPRGTSRSGLTTITGDVALAGPWQDAIDGTDAIVHLAGEPLTARRWSRAQKRRLEESRVLGTRQVLAAIERAAARPRVLVSASAVGYYGRRGEETLDEAAPAGTGFLAELCRRWEEEAGRARSLGLRVVCVRLGVVLSGHGGALARMRPAFTLLAGGPLGDPDAWFPWVHEADAVGLLLHALDQQRLDGALNAAAPGAVRMRDFARTLGRVLHRPALVRVPEGALRVLLGELATAINPGQKVVPRAALDTGYRFRHETLAPALAEALAAPGP